MTLLDRVSAQLDRVRVPHALIGAAALAAARQARVIERALRADTGLKVAAPRDVVLLKLYAGGSQDLWDIRELLRGDAAERLIAEVEADLATLPQSMHDRWKSARS